MKIFRFVKKEVFHRIDNGNESVFFPFGIETSKCRGSCNNINYPHANICVPNIGKKIY